MFNCDTNFDQRQYDVTEVRKDKKCYLSAYYGLLITILSSFCFSVVSVLVKHLGNLHPGQLAMYRFITIFAFSLPGAVKCKENLLGPKNVRFLLVLRGICGSSNNFLGFIAFRYLPLGEAAVIIFSIPVFVTLGARIFLKEPCGLFQSVAVFTTVVGICLSTKLPLLIAGNSGVYTREYVYGFLAAFGSLLFYSSGFVVIRKLKNIHHSINLLNYAWVSIIETVILTAICGNFLWHDCGQQSLFIIVLGVMSYMEQSFLTLALQYELAGPVSTMMAASDIILAFVWQIFLFQDVPDVYSYLAAILVVLSVVLLGLNKWVSTLPSDSSVREKLGWVLK